MRLSILRQFFPVLFFALMPAKAAVVGTEPRATLPVLNSAREVRHLSPAEARRGYRVHLRAVVTFVDPGPGELFVQDSTAGIFVFLQPSVSDRPLRPGQLVDIAGVSTPADFASSVTNADIRVLASSPMPQPKHGRFEDLLRGSQDGQWFELEGVIRSGQIKGGRLFLNVAAAGGSFVAVMPRYPGDWNRRLVDARVSLRGVLAAVFNERRQSAGVRLFVPGQEFVQVLAAAPPDVFHLAASPAVSVGQFHPLDELQRRIRVRTTVLALEPGVAMYVADSSGNLEVQPIPGCGAGTGDLVDVVGFPGVFEGRPGLQDSLCRTIGPGAPFSAIPLEASRVIPSSVGTDPSGYGFAAGTRYDGSLVRLEGALLGSSNHPEAATLLLKSGEQSFTATLPVLSASKLPLWETGSILQLTGVCLVSYNQYHRAQFFRILLRSPRDVVVLARPSWWNLSHSLWTFCVMAAACFAALAWNWFLRRQVASQTRQLRLVNERLLELSTRDPLTHAFNRRYFDQALEAELQRRARSGQPLSLVLFDLDHFKALNDNRGHQAGDDCLVRVVRALESSFRRSADVVARYGGEEFAIILPETGREAAAHLAESARRAVAALAIPHESSPTHPFVTASAGIATLDPKVDADLAVLVRAADRALYEAKRQGRNCIVCAAAPAIATVPPSKPA